MINWGWSSYHKNCFTCGKAFRVGRNDQKYCSNACRQKAYRAAKREMEHGERRAGVTDNSQISAASRNALEQIGGVE